MEAQHIGQEDGEKETHGESVTPMDTYQSFCEYSVSDQDLQVLFIDSYML